MMRVVRSASRQLIRGNFLTKLAVTTRKQAAQAAFEAPRQRRVVRKEQFMVPGDTVVMAHPDGYATVTGGGNEFVAWIPNGIRGVVYVLTPEHDRAVVHFDGKLIATVACDHLRVEPSSAVAPVAETRVGAAS